MVILQIQILDQPDAPPPAPEHHEFRLGFLPRILFAVVVVDEDLGDGEVLGAAAARVQRVDGDGDVGCGQVVAVGGGVVGEEGEDDAAGCEDEEAGVGEGAVKEAEEGAAGAREGFGGDGAFGWGFVRFEEVLRRSDGWWVFGEGG